MTGLVLATGETSLQLSRAWANWAGAALLGLLSLHDLGVLSYRLPSRHRQVPMRWKYLPGYWSPFVFGFVLGAGAFTNIYLASYFAVGIIAVLSRNMASSIAIAVAFGLGRTLLIVAASHPFHAHDADDLIERLAPKRKIVTRLNGLVIAVLAMILGLSHV